MKYGFIIDNRKCIGCHACTVACRTRPELYYIEADFGQTGRESNARTGGFEHP
jgi:Fe-S-cluster-containing dehydrogenase component